MKIEKDPLGQRPFRYDTSFWSHFGHGDGWSYGRCNRCVEHVYRTRTPSEDTVNCWKLLVFGDAVSDFPAVQRYLVERAEREPQFLGKWRRKANALAVVYAKSELERDRLRASLYRELKEQGLLKKAYLPYRRGCKAFERLLGPWRQWKVSEGSPVAPVPPPELGEYAED